jgi:hypothetical protein
MATIKTEQGTYLIRGNWTADQLRDQYREFVRKYSSEMPFDRWLTERGKVYFRYHRRRRR